MALHSSTSNSDGWPWAGLVALVLVLAIDALAFESCVPWDAALRRIEPSDVRFWERGITKDRLVLQEAARVHDRPRVFVIGSSRANAAFVPRKLGDGDTTAAYWGKLTHPGIAPFEIRALADEVLSYQPAGVVILLSEFDTHSELSLRANAACTSFRAIADLLAETGAGFAFEQRHALYRLVLARLFDAYRYRAVLGRAWLDSLHRFRFDTRLEEPVRISSPPAIASRASLQLSWDRVNAIVRPLQARVERPLDPEIDQVRHLGRGAHVPVQMALIHRAVHALREAGVQVILVEAPLHPIAAKLYDVSIRSDFRLFAESLVTRESVAFLSLDTTGPFEDADFKDLTHLTGDGSRRLTRAIAASVRSALARAADSS